ncbi:MAG: glycosyltransferase [Bacteroidales bacterium]
MIYLAYFIIYFTALRLLVAVFNMFTKQWLHPGNPTETPLVSVLIPARNEEKKIGNLIEQLQEQMYPNLEILIYDDLSEDGTYQLAQSYAETDSRFLIINGQPLPEGWLGKNHACHQLAKQAKGKYFLFLDADVTIGKNLINQAMAHVQRHNLALLSIFPVQQMRSFSEKITVPLMNWILVSLLPLIFTRISGWSSFSAANGQFMLFEASVYRKHQYHKIHCTNKVEDITIFRYMKKQSLKVHTILGNKQINCRMYETWEDAIKGFSKNVFEFFGGSKIAAILYGLITTFGFIFVVLALPLQFFLLYFSMVVLLRIIIAALSRQNILSNLLLAPLQQIGFLYVILKAYIWQKNKSTQWKGRNIDQILKIK